MLEAGDFPEGRDQCDAEKVAPRVIPEGKHPIRLSDLDKEALKVLYRLRDAGFAGYLVGGGVRDLCLGKRPKDFDISTDARPGQIRKLFRNSRTIGRRFRLVQVYFRGGKIIEVSTLRSQGEFDLQKKTDTVLPSNNTFGTLAEDAFRRDLTINSLFYEVENRTILDYVGGVEDLSSGVIRIVGEPGRRITRDPVRMMRAVRHAARNGFGVDPDTWEAIVEHAPKLDLCPPSRIRDEVFKDLRSGSSAAWAELSMRCGIFYTLFPVYREMFESAAGKGEKEFLLSLFKVVDRLAGTAARSGFELDIADHFLLTLLVLPWMNTRYDLLAKRKKGNSFYHLSRDIRSDIDRLFTKSFNLKKMIRESMVTLLVNLSSFAHHHPGQSWPKWQRQKSYFDECLRFYLLVAEAKGQEKVDHTLFSQKTAREDEGRSPVSAKKTGNGRSRGRRGARPALGHRGKGVFGLRKK